MKPEIIKICLFGILIIIVSGNIHAQKSKEHLQKEKQIALQKISEAEKILKETENQKKVNIGQLSAISQQIKAQESLINTINSEISLINDEMGELDLIVQSLEFDLGNLQTEYSVMVYQTYKSNYGLKNLTFIFSAETFAQLFRRLKFMEQYSVERKKQLSLIREVMHSLVEQKNVLELKRSEKKNLLNEEIMQNNNLVIVKKRQNQVIQDLTKRQGELNTELESRKKDIAQLDKLIAELVAAEIKASSKGKSSDKVVVNTSEAILSKSFESNILKIRWPVNSGFISSHFGNNPHPVYKKLQIPNDGVDIQTNSGEVVRAVFQGVVKAVAVVPGDMRYVVLMQHGEYFTVYAKLKEVTVKKGQSVEAGEQVGIVNTNKDGISEVQFQIWKNNQKLDPERWIVKK